MTAPRQPTTRATESSSSTETEPSTDSERIAELGRQIVSILESGRPYHSDPDLLTLWLAHEIADALTAAHADGHGSPAADRARRLILDVWTHRTGWPYGWPPEQAVRRLRALAPAETPFGERDADGGSPWLARIAQLQCIAAEETRLWMMAGLLQTGVDAETRGVNLALDDDGDDDVWALRRMVDLHDQATRWAEEAGASDPGAIRELVVDQVNSLAVERRRLLDDVIAADAEAPDDGGGRGAADEEAASGASPA